MVSPGLSGEDRPMMPVSLTPGTTGPARKRCGKMARNAPSIRVTREFPSWCADKPPIDRAQGCGLCHLLTVVAIAQRGVVNRGATDMKILLLLAIIATIVM